MVNIANLLVPHKKHFGLSIGRTSLRALEIDNRGKIIRGGEVSFITEIFDKTGSVINKKAFVDALKRLLEAGKFTTHFVAVAFSEIYVISRELILPKLQYSELKEAVSWHVKDLFPLPESDLYFDSKIIFETDKNLRLSVIAVPKTVLDPIIEVLLTVGLKPLVFEPGASAISRLIRLNPDSQALVVQANRRGAYVSLMEGDKALFTMVVNYRTATFESNFRQIMATIDEMISFYKSRGLLKDKLEIIVTGELANNELMKKFQTSVKIPVSILKLGIDKQEYSKAFAMAMTQVKPPADPFTINLLPAEIQNEYDRDYQNAFFTALFMRTAIFVSALLLVATGVYLSINFTKKNLDREVQNLTEVTKIQSRQTQNLLQLNAQAKNIIALAPLRSTPKDKILTLINILPPGISITEWQYDDAKQQFTLVGTALKRDDLLLFKQKLEETEEFAKVNLPLEYLELPQNISFSLTFLTKK